MERTDRHPHIQPAVIGDEARRAGASPERWGAPHHAISSPDRCLVCKVGTAKGFSTACCQVDGAATLRLPWGDMNMFYDHRRHRIIMCRTRKAELQTILQATAQHEYAADFATHTVRGGRVE